MAIPGWVWEEARGHGGGGEGEIGRARASAAISIIHARRKGIAGMITNHGLPWPVAATAWK